MPGAYHSLRGRQRAVVVALVILIAVDALAVLSSAAEFSLLGRLERGEVVPDNELDANDRRQAAVAESRGPAPSPGSAPEAAPAIATSVAPPGWTAPELP